MKSTELERRRIYHCHTYGAGGQVEGERRERLSSNHGIGWFIHPHLCAERPPARLDQRTKSSGGRVSRKKRCIVVHLVTTHGVFLCHWCFLFD